MTASSRSAEAGHQAHDHGAMAPRAAPPSGTETSQEAYADYTADMHAGMDRMMQDMHADPPSGDPDIDFLAMMIPHHAGAVEMARLVLCAGRDPLVREIAEKIMASQISEIAGMQGRLAALRRKEPAFPSLTGNRGT
jgi:uncharacterized protein (DUF305 family)